MLFQLAWRNLWRNKRRTVLTLSVMVFGLISGLLTFAVGDGSHLQMIRIATSTFIGHIQINRRGFHETQRIELTFSESDKPVDLLRRGERSGYPWLKYIDGWAPRVFGGALISTGRYTAGAYTLGLDFRREQNVTTLPHSILRGMLVQYLLKRPEKRVYPYDRLPPKLLEALKSRFEESLGKRSPTILKRRELKRLIDKTVFYFLKGYQRKYPKKISEIISNILRKNEVALGKSLAIALGVQIGSTVALVAQGIDGSIGNDRFTVVSIVETGSPDLDVNLTILPIRTLQELLAMEGRYHSAVIKVTGESDRRIRWVASKFSGVLGGRQWEVLPWQKIAPALYEYIKLDEGNQFVWVFVIFVLIAFVILNTLQMSIFERIKEFGILMALGMGRSQIVALVISEGLILALLSIFTGMLLGVPAMFYLREVGIPLSEPIKVAGVMLQLQLEAEITLQGLIFSPAVILFSTLFVSFYPAYLATRAQPSEAMKNG